jgi:hypothetical protein
MGTNKGVGNANSFICNPN